MGVPQLVSVTLALPDHIKALSHVVIRINELIMPETIDAAVYNDCQYIIHTHGATRKWTTKAMDGAAARGRLDLVKWLSVVRNEGCSIAALDGATRNGHLKLVRWLCHHYINRCSSGALNMAAKNGHFEVVKWLCRRNRSQNDSIPYVVTYGVQAVASAGDTTTLRALLRENCSWFYVGRALEDAASKGLIDVVKLLLTVKLRQANVSRALKNAVIAGQYQVVKLLADLCSSAELRAAYPNMTTGGNVKIADLLRKTVEGRDVEEKWGYFRTQHKTLERMKASRNILKAQDKAVSFCGLLRSW
ncbi:Myosin light chain kinase-related [Plasmopara halstedii]|uniref:Myosin light chain kinase-related n=1 Tax=Plasmopara halstedii TaxID=4781 RepID=A0A0N7L5R4_PLAHL|nr:Myosin light chain kinase-related [Plasmopara halstedii]CEG42203.1 Myosin light chain kinase-related [Plasmopara halstedii]|eukprot:XP_024578572.1 Myosin light chain kinase-related [Plasmopara halstedii]